jgi:hypothetical protein
MLTKIISSLFIFIAFYAFNQTNTNSPFSSRGIGELTPLSHSIFGALGNVSTPMIDSAVLNTENPSSYAFLGKGQPIFSIGLATTHSQFSQNNNTSASTYIALNHFTLGMSITNRFGICFGLKPYSSTGYENTSSKQIKLDTLNYYYKGSGGYSNAFFGFSYKLLHIHQHSISVGTNLGYLFGTSKNEITTTLSNATLGGIRDRSLQIKALNYELGMSYQYQFSKDHAFVLGGTYSPSQSYNGTYTNTMIYALSTTNVLGNDTLSYAKTFGKITSPTTYSVGFKYDFTNRNQENSTSDRSPQIQVCGEMRIIDWSTYSNNLSTPETFNKSTQYSVGFQFAPHYDFLDRAKNINLIHRMKYRIGGIYQTLPWSDQQIQLTNKAFTFGIGIPIISQFSSSSINLSCLYGQRWNGLNTSVKENYFTFNFGVNITPASYERWFKKSKID